MATYKPPPIRKRSGANGRGRVVSFGRNSVGKRWGLLLTVAIVPIFLTAGCQRKRTVIADIPAQQAGKVTYSVTGNAKPSWVFSGSAKYLKSVPCQERFDRLPHWTYVVFRDRAANKDHVISFEAAGELVLTEDLSDTKVKTTAESQYREFEIKADQPPISVELTPRKIELLTLSSNLDEPKIILTSDAQVQIKTPTIFEFAWPEFGLDEVKSIKLKKNLVGGAKIVFDLAEKEHSVELSDGATAAQHFADLEGMVKTMAPHVEFRSGRDWRLIGSALLAVFALVGSVAIVIALILNWAVARRWRIAASAAVLQILAGVGVVILMLGMISSWDAGAIGFGVVGGLGVIAIIGVAALIVLIIARNGK